MYQPGLPQSFTLSGIVIVVADHDHRDGSTPSSKLPQSFPSLLSVPARRTDDLPDHLCLPVFLEEELRSWVIHCQTNEDDYLEFCYRLGLSGRRELLSEDYVTAEQGLHGQRVFWRSVACAQLLKLFGSWRLCQVCDQLLERFRPVNGGCDQLEYKTVWRELYNSRGKQQMLGRWPIERKAPTIDPSSQTFFQNGMEKHSIVHIPLIIQAIDWVEPTQHFMSPESTSDSSPPPPLPPVQNHKKDKAVHMTYDVHQSTPTSSKTTTETTVLLRDPTPVSEPTPVPELPPVPEYITIPISELQQPPQRRRRPTSTSVPSRGRIQKRRQLAARCGPVTRSQKPKASVTRPGAAAARAGGSGHFTRSQARAKG